MATKEEPKEKEEVQFSGRAISLYGIWFLSQFVIIVGMLATITLATLGVLFFYTVFTLAVMVLALYLAFIRGKAEKLKELMSLNVTDSIYPFIVIGVGSFLAFYIMHNIMGNQINVPSNWMDIFMMQAIIIVPAETFIFVYFMVNILPKKITIWMSKKGKKREIYIPGWMVAQISFATFHWRVYDLNPFQMFFAFAMGVVFYQMYIGGKTVSFLGLPAVIAFHFVWNIMAILYGGAGTPPGSMMYDPLTIGADWVEIFAENATIGVLAGISISGISLALSRNIALNPSRNAPTSLRKGYRPTYKSVAGIKARSLNTQTLFNGWQFRKEPQSKPIYASLSQPIPIHTSPGYTYLDQPSPYCSNPNQSQAFLKNRCNFCK